MLIRIFTLMLLATVTGCLDPYSPPIAPSDVNILVVDGSLDTSEGEAFVKLTQGVALSLPDSFPPIEHATVAIIDGLGNFYPLTESSPGTYQAADIPIHSDAEYRLRVVTQEDHEYYSDVVSVRTTPPIDSVTWVTDDEKLTIRVNAHDDTGQTKYYRWTLEETWNYHAAVVSQYKVVGKSIVFRKPEEIYFYCWRTQPSSNIIIGSTVRLREDIISQVPVQYIPAGSQKFQMLYSILVRQRAISKEEYEYLDQLKKTTESIGGLFDPQPGQVTGNISRANPESPLAVGYFGAGNTVSKRVFIKPETLPRPFREIYPRAGCNPPDTVCVTPGTYVCSITVNDLTEAHILGQSIDDDAAYTLTNLPCSDCRYQGGVLAKPDFWP